MLNILWETILINPILNFLVILYHFSGNLGASIIFLTIAMRLILTPVTIPSMNAMKKQKELQPELDKLKEKYKHDKQKQAEMQMKLFKEHGLNPASGCLTQVAMIVVLIALYGVISQFSGATDINQLNSKIYFEQFKVEQNTKLETGFLYMDLAKPDPYLILAFLSGLLQFFVSKMTFPYTQMGEKAAKKTPDKTDDIAYNIQEQMQYTLPVMNFVIGVKLPAGVVLYLVTTTLFSLIQTYFVSGLGGLKPWMDKIQTWTKKKQ